MRILTFTAGDFAENGYVAVARDGVTAVAIDPGAAAPDMIDVLLGEGLDLRAILLTHAHLDHVEGVSAVRAHKAAPIYLHPADRGLYDALPAQAAAFMLTVDSPPPPDRELAHGQTLEFGGSSFEVRHAPGHSSGHVILYCEEALTAFVGDVVFAGSIGRTDLPGGDFQTLMRSIREQVLTLPPETRLLTGHGPHTTVRQERMGNPFLIPHYGGELA